MSHTSIKRSGMQRAVRLLYDSAPVYGIESEFITQQSQMLPSLQPQAKERFPNQSNLQPQMKSKSMSSQHLNNFYPSEFQTFDEQSQQLIKQNNQYEQPNNTQLFTSKTKQHLSSLVQSSTSSFPIGSGQISQQSTTRPTLSFTTVSPAPSLNRNFSSLTLTSKDFYSKQQVNKHSEYSHQNMQQPLNYMNTHEQLLQNNTSQPSYSALSIETAAIHPVNQNRTSTSPIKASGKPKHSRGNQSLDRSTRISILEQQQPSDNIQSSSQQTGQPPNQQLHRISTTTLTTESSSKGSAGYMQSAYSSSQASQNVRVPESIDKMKRLGMQQWKVSKLDIGDSEWEQRINELKASIKKKMPAFSSKLLQNYEDYQIEPNKHLAHRNVLLHAKKPVGNLSESSLVKKEELNQQGLTYIMLKKYQKSKQQQDFDQQNKQKEDKPVIPTDLLESSKRLSDNGFFRFSNIPNEKKTFKSFEENSNLIDRTDFIPTELSNKKVKQRTGSYQSFKNSLQSLYHVRNQN